MKRFLPRIERALDEALPRPDARPKVLFEAMRYAVGTGGKRIRPSLCCGAAVAAGGRAEEAIPAAVAIELLHNYTLVHDDLPAMDGDVMRRGQPSVWKKYGEANAILVGDALQALAFRHAAASPRNAAAIVAELGAQGVGVVRGQVEDVKAASAPRDEGEVAFIYEHKTADLFMAAAVMGALAVGAEATTVAALRCYARNLGLAFQYEDDLLDGDAPFGAEKTRGLVRAATDAAKASLATVPGDTDFLARLAETLVGRSV